MGILESTFERLFMLWSKITDIRNTQSGKLYYKIQFLLMRILSNRYLASHYKYLPDKEWAPSRFTLL